jgi:glycosyltransferase involved in cell wall biosynthesis
MKALDIVHTESSLGWGGQEIRILSEAAGMIHRGHRVRLLCPRDARIHDEAARFGVPVEALPIGRKNLRGLAALTGWLGANGGASRPGVINTHSSTDSWLVALAQLRPGGSVPIVRTRHISAPVPRNWMTRWLYARAAKRVVTTGEALRLQLIADTGIKPETIESVPTGIDTTRFAPGGRSEARAKLGLPADKTLVGIVATLRSWKGHRYLIEACAALPADTGLVIVGDGPQRASMEALLHAHGMKNRAWMPGNQVDVVPWLQAIDIFALPSYANEGVPQALIQAMLVGLPCVTTSAGSIGELARPGETALVVPMEDAPALRAAIAGLIGDPGLRVRLGVAARAHCIEGYSFERMLDRMEQVFGVVQENVRKFPGEAHAA